MKAIKLKDPSVVSTGVLKNPNFPGAPSSVLDKQVAEAVEEQFTRGRTSPKPGSASQLAGDPRASVNTIRSPLRQELRLTALLQMFADMSKISPNARVTKALDGELCDRLNNPRLTVDDFLFEEPADGR